MSLDEENAALRRQVEGLETQLVAYDAVLDGNIELAQHIAPGIFEVRRRHAVERIPLAVLREVFPIPQRYVPLHRDNAGVGVEETDDNYYLRQIWTGEDRVRPRRIFVSCALRDGDQSPLSLTVGLSQCEPGGTRPVTRTHTNIPRSGDTGLPSGFTWLATSWSLELRDTAGWEIGSSMLRHPAHNNIGALAGVVEFRYSQHRISERPLSDALRPHGIDLCCVMREHVYYEIRMEVTAPLVVRPLDPAVIPSSLPRLYVFLEVIAREAGW